MTIYEISCNRSEVISSFRIIKCRVILKWGLEKRARLTLLEELLVPTLVLDNPGLRWMFSDVDLLQGFLLFDLRLGI